MKPVRSALPVTAAIRDTSARQQAQEVPQHDKIIKILLIEDNAADARLLREMLKEPVSCTYDLTHHESMEKAVAYLAANPVDVILLDLGLPDAQGLEAVRRVRRAAPHVPLVVLTGLDDESMAS